MGNIIIILLLIIWVSITVVLFSKGYFSQIKFVITKEKSEFEHIEEAPLKTIMLDTIGYKSFRPMIMLSPIKMMIYQHFIIAEYKNKWEKFEYNSEQLEIEEEILNHSITLKRNKKEIKLFFNSENEYNFIRNLIYN